MYHISQRKSRESKVTNMDALSVIGLQNAMTNMTNVKGILEKILNDRKYKSRLSEKLMHECIKRYHKENDLLTKALEYIKLRDYDEAFGSLHTARTVPRSYEMQFNGDNNQTFPVTNENEVLFKMIYILYIFTARMRKSNA